MITILMSTYNGSKYIDQQLRSIVNQSIGLKNINIIVRDDGSIDSTISKLKSSQKKFKNISIIQGENVGVAQSFWELIKKSPLESEYYAFSDQDDIWQIEKMSNAIAKLKNIKEPALYYSNAMLADKSGISLDRLLINKKNNLSVPTIMAGLPALGCTMVFNRAAMDIFKSAKLTGIEMHDRTCFLITYLIGTVVYDNAANIYYRQHDNNVIGNAGKKTFKHFIKKYKQSFKLWFKNNKHSSVIQAQDMLSNFSHLLKQEDKEYLKAFTLYRKNPIKKYALLNDKNLKYLSKGTLRSFKLRLLLNLL